MKLGWRLLNTIVPRSRDGEISLVSDREFIRSFLACGDVSAFPSRLEGFPNAPVEAMAAGLPVVAAAASGVREIFQDGENSGGIVIPVNDVAPRLGECGRHKARSFSLETVGAQLERVLFSRASQRPYRVLSTGLCPTELLTPRIRVTEDTFASSERDIDLTESSIPGSRKDFIDFIASIGLEPDDFRSKRHAVVESEKNLLPR